MPRGASASLSNVDQVSAGRPAPLASGT